VLREEGSTRAGRCCAACSYLNLSFIIANINNQTMPPFSTHIRPSFWLGFSFNDIGVALDQSIALGGSVSGGSCDSWGFLAAFEGLGGEEDLVGRPEEEDDGDGDARIEDPLFGIGDHHSEDCQDTSEVTDVVSQFPVNGVVLDVIQQRVDPTSVLDDQ
jgi:hypothetical protein